MSRMIAPSSGRTDQRKVYTDWANNRLKKAGQVDLQVSDLQKDIPDGYLLPRIISAVVHEDVPGILSVPDTDYEKKQNIEACVMFLQRLGINCSGFSAKDISEGSMRAILQLFFNLSQYKPKDNTESAPPPQPSRLRPVSPGLRMVHSVKPMDKLKLSSATTNGTSSSQLSTPSTSQSSSANTSPVTTPLGNPPLSGLSKPGGVPAPNRRTAGSTIPTGLDPLGQSRRVQYRPLNITTGGPNLADSKSSPLSSSPSPMSPQDDLVTAGQSTQATPTVSMPRPTGMQAPKSGMLRTPGNVHGGLKSPNSDKSLHGSSESVKSDDGIPHKESHVSKLGRSNSSIASPSTRLKLNASGRSTPNFESGLARPNRFQKSSMMKQDDDQEQQEEKSVPTQSPLLKKRSNTLPTIDKPPTAIPAAKDDEVPTDNKEHKRSISGLMKPATSKLAQPSDIKLTNSETVNDNSSENKPAASKLQRLTQLPGPSSKLKAPAAKPEPKQETQSVEPPATKNETKEEEIPSKDQEQPSKTTSKLAQLTRRPVQSQLRKASAPTKLQQPSLSALTSTDKTKTTLPSPLNINTNVSHHPGDPAPNGPTPSISRPTPSSSSGISSGSSTSNGPTPSTSGSSDVSRTTSDPVTSDPRTTSDPVTSDPRSSSSSIGSFNSSNSSHSDSSITETLTPSPFGGRKYGRRTSPEGMSVEETASPRDDKLSDLSNELEKSKEEVFLTSTNAQELLLEETKSDIKRAQSLSPNVSRRIFPSATLPSPLSDATSVAGTVGSEENIHSKPKRSSLRSPKQPGDQHSDKHVTISPHSSVDSFSSSDNSLSHGGGGTPVKGSEPAKRISQSDRPKSMEDLESFPGGELQPNLIRRGSTRSEKLDYSDVETFLDTGLTERAGSSTPELLETYETQLSHLKKDLESKAKMLTMYETSMADLSTKVTTLKRTLEEKDAAIKHLTEEKHRWQDFDSHSLAPSRLAVTTDIGGISDGARSDGDMDIEKDEPTTGKKKSKKWKPRFLRRGNKKEHDMNHLEVASLAGSVSGGVAASRSLKRAATIGGGSRSKPSDLISISEYSTVETHTIKDFDAKSVDAHSEYGGFVSVGLMDEMMTVYEESGPGANITVELLMDDVQSSHDDSVETVTLGTINVTEECSWVLLDSKVCDIFEHHINAIDPEQSLHLTDDSILYYMVDDVRRSIGNALLPFATPFQAVNNDSRITIALKGAAQECCDALAYKYLITVDVFQSYIAMMLETQWLVVMGTKGTCKTSLAEGLVSYLELFVAERAEEEEELVIDDSDKSIVKRFSISSAPGSVGGGIEEAMRYIKQELPRRVERSATPILLFDNIYDCQSLEQLFSAASTLPKRPYIVSTLCSGSTRGIPLHQLMFRHNIRVVTCSPHVEPIVGILSRTLRKQVYRMKADPEGDIDLVAEHLLNWLPYLLDHLNYFINKFHSNNVALGPRVFMNCPLDSSAGDMEVWFINLWNHFIIPYLMGTIMAGIETYSADPHLDWIDVREWVVETYPWQSMGMSKLKTLTPEDVGWNHAVRPQQHNRFMYMRDDDVQSVLRMQ